MEHAVDVIERTRGGLVLDGGASGLPRMMRWRPNSRISRSTVQRATSTPYRINWRQTLRTP
jgi:hypothetical protein